MRGLSADRRGSSRGHDLLISFINNARERPRAALIAAEPEARGPVRAGFRLILFISNRAGPAPCASPLAASAGRAAYSSRLKLSPEATQARALACPAPLASGFYRGARRAG